MHLVRQLLDEHGQLRARHPGQLLRVAAGAGRGAHARHGRLAAGLLSPSPADELRVVPHDVVEDVGDPLAQRLRVEPALEVVGDLLGAPAAGLVDRLGHGGRDRVGVHVHLSRHVAGRAADRLDQAGAGAQEALLVGVEDRDQRHLRQVEALAQQVDADQHVVVPLPQLLEQLDPADRVDLRVQVAHPDAELEQVVGQVLAHLLGQRRDQDPLVALGAQPDLVHEVVDLALGRLDDDLGVDQAGRADHLLDDVGTGAGAGDAAQLVRSRGRRQVDGLADPLEELLPLQRAVVHRARQPEAVVDQRRLAGAVALVHRPDLRHRHMALVEDQQEVLGEVVEQRVRRGALRTPVDVAAVVLDAVAEADLAHHLDVVGGPHAQPLRLQQLALALHLGEPVGELELDALDRPLHPLRPGDVVGRGEDEDLLVLLDHLARERVQRHDPLYFVAEHLDPDGQLLVDREDLHGVASHPERAAGEGEVVAGVLHVHEPAQQLVALDGVADGEPDHAVDVLLRGPQAVDARHRRHHDDVPPGQQAHRRGVPQPLDLLVDRGVLLDVGVGLRDVGLGLVVVVVADEVLDRVVGQQLAELVGQLGGQRLVRRHDQRRSLHLLDQPGGGRALARAGRAEQDDVGLAVLQTGLELGDRGGLVTRRLVVADDLEAPRAALEVGREPGDRGHRAVRVRSHSTTVRPASDSPVGSSGRSLGHAAADL